MSRRDQPQQRRTIEEIPVQLYSLEEAATLLRTSPDWLRGQVRRRTIPHRRLGRNEVIFTAQDLEQIVIDAKREPSAVAAGPVGRRRRR